MKGWVGLVGWPIADGLPTLVITHQLQVKRRTGKVRRPETDVLPLCHATTSVQSVIYLWQTWSLLSFCLHLCLYWCVFCVATVSWWIKIYILLWHRGGRFVLRSFRQGGLFWPVAWQQSNNARVIWSNQRVVGRRDGPPPHVGARSSLAMTRRANYTAWIGSITQTWRKTDERRQWHYLNKYSYPLFAQRQQLCTNMYAILH